MKTAIESGVCTALILSKIRETAVVVNLIGFVKLLYPSMGKSIQFTVDEGQIKRLRPLVKTCMVLSSNSDLTLLWSTITRSFFLRF